MFEESLRELQSGHILIRMKAAVKHITMYSITPAIVELKNKRRKNSYMFPPPKHIHETNTFTYTQIDVC